MNSRAWFWIVYVLALILAVAYLWPLRLWEGGVLILFFALFGLIGYKLFGPVINP